MTTPTTTFLCFHTTALPRVTALALGLALVLALSTCGGGKTNVEPNLVPPGAPRAADIPPASGVQPAESAASAPAPAPSASTPALPASAPIAAAPSPARTSLKSQIQALERSGAVPALDRSASLTGPDANNNGVRDDIEAYIAGLPVSAVQKRAAMQSAKALQNTLTADVQDKVALQKLGDGLMASSKCLGAVFAPDMAAMSDMSGKIEAMTANTKERAKRYMQYNSARSGSVTSMPSGDTCDK